MAFLCFVHYKLRINAPAEFLCPAPVVTMSHDVMKGCQQGFRLSTQIGRCDGETCSRVAQDLIGDREPKMLGIWASLGNKRFTGDFYYELKSRARFMD